MRLSEFCISRPVFSWVLSLTLIVLGVLAFTQLHIRFDPKVFTPTLNIETSYSGASPEVVEQTITQKLENALAGIPNVDKMISNSLQGKSNVELHFKQISEEQFIIAQSDVMRVIFSASLPDKASKPKVFSRGNNDQILLYGFTSKQLNPQQLEDYIYNYIDKPTQTIPGVGDVEIWANFYGVRVSLNPDKLARYQLMPSTIIDAINSNNQSLPSGQIVTKQQNLPLNSSTTLSKLSQFNHIVVGKFDNRLLYLKDVASISIGPADYPASFSLLNGKNSVGLSYSSTDDANPLQVGTAVKNKLKQLFVSLPNSIQPTLVYDKTNSLKQSIKEIFKTILLAVSLVILITFLFLGRFRFTLVPIVAIPVCLVSVFSVLLILGLSINVMTLLALVLAVGLVVDDSIVVLENYHRHVKSGANSISAAKSSINEISFAVIGMTIILVAVYAPTAFMHGHVATYFQQFAFTLAACVLISGFVALTLSPMMCGRIPTKLKTSRYERYVVARFEGLTRLYAKLLTYVLKHRTLLMILFLVLSIGGYGLFKSLHSTLEPKEDIGVVVAPLSTDESSNPEYIETKLLPLIKKFQQVPTVKNVFSFDNLGGNSGSDQAINIISLTPWQQRNTTSSEIAKKLVKIIHQSPYFSGGAFPMSANGTGGSFGSSQISFYVSGLTTYNNLSDQINTFIQQLNKYPGVNGVYSSLKFNYQQYDIHINHQLAAELGVTVDNINDALHTLFGGYTLDNGFQYNGIEYDIVLQLPKKDLATLSTLDKIYVPSSKQGQVQLSRLVSVKPSVSLANRVHYNQMRAGEVGLNITDGYSLGQVINHISSLAKQALPGDTQLNFTGEAERYLSGNSTIVLVFLLGIVFIYLILAALFESFVDPLIILFTVPVCIIGALAALYLIGGTLNIYTGIGLVTLVGLVAKHGVLITQFANQLVVEGKPLFDAVIGAASIRLRPILMTTATMCLGALPLIFAVGPSSNGRIQIGWVIVTGLLVGTFFSLFIVPVVYTLLFKLKRRSKN